MTQRECEKLTNFCNKIEVKVNEETGGFMSYFTYKDKTYYASICFIREKGNEIAIFSACDDYVTSWNPLYRMRPNDITIKSLRKHIYFFLERRIHK